METNARVLNMARITASALGAVLALVFLLAFLTDARTQAAPLRSVGTGADPRIQAITITSNLPISDTHPGDGITRTVYFSNAGSGVITLTFDISGTQALTLTAGAAFGDPEQVLTSSTSPWRPVITYSVGTGGGDYPGVAYTTINTYGVQTSIAITYVRDITGPTASILSPPAGYFSSTTLLITGMAQDDNGGAGVRRVQVTTGTTRMTATGATAWTYTWTLPITDGKSYTLSARAEDFLGALGAAATRVITLDLTPPDVGYGIPPILIVSSSGLYAAGPTVYYTSGSGFDRYFIVRGTATDTLSGAGAAYATPALGTAAPGNSGTWERWAFTYWVPPGATTSGRITATLSDAAGHAIGWVFTYTHDPLAPAGVITIQEGVDYVSIPTVTLNLLASDNLTGCGMAQMCISDEPTCSHWESYITTKPWTLAGDDGDETVYVRYRDHLGNTSDAFSDTVFLDRVPPVVTVTAPPQTSEPTFTVSWEAPDPEPGSGVVSYSVAYREDEGAWVIWYPSTTLTQATFLNGALEHTYVFSVTAYDRAGNSAEGTATIRVDLFRVYLPLTLHGWVWWYQYDIYEPNDTRAQAYGPLVSSQVYTSYIYSEIDQKDYYSLTVASPEGQIIVDLTVPDCCDYDLYLYDSPTGSYIAASNYMGKGLDEHIVYDAPQAGIVYYVLVYSPYKDHSSEITYALHWRFQ